MNSRFKKLKGISKSEKSTIFFFNDFYSTNPCTVYYRVDVGFALKNFHTLW